MNKKTPEKKFILLSSLALSFLIFIFFVLGSYLQFILNMPLYGNLLVFFVLSIIASVLIVFGFTIFSATITDAMVTLRRMLRIENLSNPLLLKLSSEAPGTYHHSINVSNLAQKSARVIGANSLLIRTAAYYHDIGKLQNPKAFTENQSEEEIPHDETERNIQKRAKEIISHVQNGLKIAHQYKLPEEVMDLIAEHHGTTQATYFYEKAKEKGLKVKKTDFRYEGPKPGSKESVILMIADCVEAGARSFPSLTKENIKSIVDSTIDDKVTDKQILSSVISDNELSKVRETMIENLLSIYHQRINYKNNEN